MRITFRCSAFNQMWALFLFPHLLLLKRAARMGDKEICSGLDFTFQGCNSTLEQWYQWWFQVLNAIKDSVLDPANRWALWPCSSKTLRNIYGTFLPFMFAIRTFAVLGENRHLQGKVHVIYSKPSKRKLSGWSWSSKLHLVLTRGEVSIYKGSFHDTILALISEWLERVPLLTLSWWQTSTLEWTPDLQRVKVVQVSSLFISAEFLPFSHLLHILWELPLKHSILQAQNTDMILIQSWNLHISVITCK